MVCWNNFCSHANEILKFLALIVHTSLNKLLNLILNSDLNLKQRKYVFPDTSKQKYTMAESMEIQNDHSISVTCALKTDRVT